MHKHHRQKQTDGDTERHNDSGAEVPQEQHEDNDGQQRAEQQIFQHRADDQIDVLALIAEGGEVQTLVFFLQLGHDLLVGKSSFNIPQGTADSQYLRKCLQIQIIALH